MEPQKLRSVLESLLFVSGEPIKVQKLAKICNLPKNDIEAGLAELAKYFEAERGLRIIKKDDSVQLATSPENAEFVNQLVSGELSAELSKSAIETLSIVAYRGPITRVQIEAIRGVNCSYVLRSLLMKGLVERKETADIRGFVYQISFDFLKTLGIGKVEDLPDWSELSTNQKVEQLISEPTDESTPTEIIHR